MKGAFIVIEGPDGSGTTTHAALLTKRLKDAGKKVLATHEPSKGPIGTFIRGQLQVGEIPSLALQMLFMADRAWHVEKVILPALESGQIVISDRYSLSTVIYGQALGLDAEWLTEMNKKFIQPDILLLALPPLSVCMQRLGKRSSKDMLETDELQKKIYQSYELFAKDGKTPVVDTSANFDTVSEHIFELVMKSLPSSL